MGSKIVTIITPGVTSTFHDVYSAEYLLETLDSIDVILDFHGVVDLLPNTYNFKNCMDNKNIAILSFVGRKTSMYEKTCNTITSYVNNNQVDMGILVFNRGKKGEICTEPGSKAWVISKINQGQEIRFIDDSIDHIESIQSLNLPNLELIHLDYDFKNKKENEKAKLKLKNLLKN